jgi:hypothetical protein
VKSYQQHFETKAQESETKKKKKKTKKKHKKKPKERIYDARENAQQRQLLKCQKWGTCYKRK